MKVWAVCYWNYHFPAGGTGNIYALYKTKKKAKKHLKKYKCGHNDYAKVVPMEVLKKVPENGYVKDGVIRKYTGE